MRIPNFKFQTSKRPSAAFTLIEILISIAITAVLALAVAVAIGASLTAYTTSSEMASMQTSSRLVMQKTMAMIRNASLHDAYDPSDGSVTLLQPTDTDHPLQTVGIQMQLADGNLVKIWWVVNDDYSDGDLGDLWYQQNTSTAQTLIERVRCLRTNGGDAYVFTLASRTSDTGLLLSRATLDLTVERDAATTTSMEQARAGVGAMRVVSSTMPRKNTD